MFGRVLVGLFFVLAVARAIPKPEDDPKHRVIDKELSDEEHFIKSEHNPAYDHEAFLGEEAKTFDQLTPEESSRRLGIIVDKIDKDEDGFISQEELKDWIRFVQRKNMRDDVVRQWQYHNPEGLDKLPWENYRKMVYGFMDDKDFGTDIKKGDDKFAYTVMLKRDRRRWSYADQDRDDALTEEEFTSFLHPQEFEHMKHVAVLETLEDIDKDGDEKISIVEYIGDMYRGEEGDEEPEWVKNEKEQFSRYRDKDGDGFMDTEEVKNWIIPEDFDHAEAEARHLIYEADHNSDNKLTKSEVLEKYDVFVSSQATDFGDALARHDEF